MARKRDPYYFDNFIACQKILPCGQSAAQGAGRFQTSGAGKISGRNPRDRKPTVEKNVKYWIGWQKNLFPLLNGRIL